MKIAMLDPANLTPFYTYALCDNLVKIGNELRFYTTQYQNDLSLKPPAAVDVVDHYFKFFRKLQALDSQKPRQIIRGLSYPAGHKRLLNLLQSNKPDIVHLQWALLPLFDYYLVRRLQKANVPVVLTVHDVTPFFNYGGERLLTRLYNRVDHLIVHHRSAVDVLGHTFGVENKAKISVVPHGPLQVEEIPANKNRADARQALGIPEDSNVVTFFGEVKYYKGLDILIDAVVKASATTPDLYLLIAGKPQSGKEIPDISILKRHGISHQARLVFIPNGDVWKYYLAADIVVLPYRQISQSGVLFSALAHKRYVVCTNVGGMPEVLNQVGGGKVVPKASVDALSQTITALMKRKEELDVEAEKACGRIFQHYGWERIARMTQALYEKITARKPC